MKFWDEQEPEVKKAGNKGDLVKKEVPICPIIDIISRPDQNHTNKKDTDLQSAVTKKTYAIFRRRTNKVGMSYYRDGQVPVIR